MPRASSPASLRSFLTSSSLRAVLAPALLLAAAACNEAETGRRSVADFVPDDCGEVICDLDDRLAVGATTDVYLSGIDGAYVDDLELISDRPSVFDVIGRESSAFPRFTVLGNAPGRADLVAIDQDGDEVDYIKLEVVRIDDFSVDAEGDQLIESGAIRDANGRLVSRYRAPVGNRVELDVEPFATGRPVMGEFDYGVVVDPQLLGAMSDVSDMRRGRFVLRVPAGEHDIIVTAPGGAYHTLRITGT